MAPNGAAAAHQAVGIERSGGTASRRLIFHALFTVALVAALIFASIEFVPAITGGERRSTGAILFATLLPVVTLLALTALERMCTPAGPRKSLESWLIHMQITVFYLIMAGVVGALAALASSALARNLGIDLGLIDLRFASPSSLVSLVAAVWLAAIATDFFFYWFHRALHKSPVLWQHHKMHHIDPELEAVTLLRQNWIEVFIAAVMITIPVAVFFRTDNLDPLQIGLAGGVATTLFLTLATMGHANLRLQAGKASVLWCTPQVHRIHHSRLPEHHDKNFAFIFPVWDVVFGTYYAPKRDEFPPTGVEGERDFSSFWEAQIFTPREWWRMYRARRERDGTPPG